MPEVSSTIHVLFVMPCWGAHFGVMANQLFAICRIHKCTILEISKLCEKKLKPFREIVHFDVLKRHGLGQEVSYVKHIEFLRQFCPITLARNEFCYEVLSEILSDSKNKFDLMMVDHIYPGAMVAAEKFDLPVIVQTVAMSGGVEHIQDKIPISFLDTLKFKYFYTPCWNWIDEKRQELRLPELDWQGRFTYQEYPIRFPMLLITSPSFFPEPHPSAEYIYIGGIRDESLTEKLGSKISSWIETDERDIIYVSLGTISALTKEDFADFREKVLKQNQFRVIWSLSIGLQNVAKEMKVFQEENEVLYLSDYLPQYALLGRSKVKYFVTHCGIGSLTDLIEKKVIPICIPQFGDQFVNTHLIEKMSLGGSIDAFDWSEIVQSVLTIEKNRSVFSENLAKVSNEFSVLESEEKLVQFMERIATRKNITIQLDLKFESNSPRFHFMMNISYYSILIAAAVLVVWFVHMLMKSLRNLGDTKANEIDKKKHK